MGLSKKAERFIKKHIKRHRRMGMGEKQAIAVAYHEARDKGFKVPSKPRKHME